MTAENTTEKVMVTIDGDRIDIAPIKSLFDLSDNALQKRGLQPEMANKWTVSIANGQIPEGFASMREFIQTISPIFERRRKGRKKKAD